MIEMTPEQDKALDAVAEWFLDDRRWQRGPFRLFGCAGVGKTTLAKQIAPRLGIGNIAVGAYTGKAASVLRRKGLWGASTIHSAIYRPTGTEHTKRALEAAQEELISLESQRSDPVVAGWADGLELAGAISEASERVQDLAAELSRGGWTLNPDSPWAEADLIVLDEVSMVDKRLAEDIESFGVPVLVLGDPEQLPPIGGNGYYTGTAPDVLLTEIHRQALESPVLALATAIRLGERPKVTEIVSVAKAMEADQILCWRNATRWKLTERIRTKLGRPAGEPVAGDRIVCKTNNKDIGVLNGMQFEVLEVVAGSYGLLLLLRDDDGQERWIDAWPDGFSQASEPQLKERRAYRGKAGAFTFANVVTVHTAQGSEWPSVYVVDETPQMIAMQAQREGEAAAREFARRWRYTAVSRASDSVTLARLRG